VQGVVLVTGVFFILMNIAADAAYRLLNPRMRDAK
jgi:peptide/nickel transport system permease protein